MKYSRCHIFIFLTVFLSLHIDESKAQPAHLDSFKLKHSNYNNAVSVSSHTGFCLFSMSPDFCTGNCLLKKVETLPHINFILINLPQTTLNIYRVNFRLFETGISPPLV